MALSGAILLAVMDCLKCGARVPDQAKQCPACGAALPVGAGGADATAVTPRPSRHAAADEATFALPPGSTRHPIQAHSASEVVDFGPRYRVERLLGQGGMGAVYLAYDQDLGRQVALKLVRAEFSVHPEAMARFRQELLLASKISHRNILRVHDLGDAGGMKFISMAYVDGEDLHQLLIREGKLPLDRMLNITRQLCSALDAAHSEGVVHRDLKPQNIMLGKDDHVFVTDFGLAKPLDVVGGMTQSGADDGHAALHGSGAGGSQERGRPHRHLRAGADLLRDVDGRRSVLQPIRRCSSCTSARREVPPPPKTIVADIPDWMNDIIMKCLEHDPANRYQSATEILADIDAQRKPPAPAAAAASSAGAPAVERPKARRYVWIAVGATAVLSLGDWRVAVSSRAGRRP